MGGRTIIVVVLALVCGLSAAIGVQQLQKNSIENQKMEKVMVVIAATDIGRSVALTEEALSVREWPKEMVPENSFRTVEEVLDRATLMTFVSGEPILETKLSPAGSGSGMAALIPDGMRAYTINTPTVSSGVAGFILPGNKVDVLLTVSGATMNDSTGGGSTTTLLQSVEVLAVGPFLTKPNADEADAKNIKSMTLLVTPDQANKLSLSQMKGTLHLALRNQKDTAEAKSRIVTMIDLRFDRESPLDSSGNGEDEDTIPIVIAAIDISRGEMISDELVSISRWPKDQPLPEGAMTSLEQVEGRVLRQSLVRNEMLIDGKLAAKGSMRGGVAALIPHGMRAYTILTPTIASGVGGFIMPGNRVDILLTVSDNLQYVSNDSRTDRMDYTGGGSTTTLMQYIEILAVDQNLDIQNPNKKNPQKLQSVTLLVVPNQAAMLSLAQEKGTLHLSLRNEGDMDAATTTVVTIKDLRFWQEALEDEDGKKSSQQANPGSTGIQLKIRTLRGGQVGRIQVLQPALTEPVTTAVPKPME